MANLPSGVLEMTSFKVEMKDTQCITCGTIFQQWVEYHTENCSLCRIAYELGRLCDLVELK